ncbi:MAG TPA: pyridoxal phosphate-dependent aminotransferase [Candidatus Sulfotelmatobacter sp.]|nr:pyridoxal phosphate-dependent aminotransferase [Candidatus Sulfotelmatobacter sp.]
MAKRAEEVVTRWQGAARVNAIAPSGTVAVTQKVRDLAARGVTVINMGGGDPDFATPEHIVEAAVRSLRGGATHYVNSLGIEPLREAIAAKLERENGVRVSPGDGVIVTPGAKYAILLALLGHLDPGDEVLVQDPAWVSYSAMIRLAEGVAVPVPTLPEEGFRLRAEALRRAASTRTRAIIVNHPVNPTGHVLDQEEIEAVAALASERDLLVISDEIYERILFPGAGHRSFGARPDLADRTLTVNGFSKTYAMTGWRLGYVAGPAGLVRPLRKAQEHSIYCVAPFIQAAGVAALSGPQECVAAMQAEYLKRRDAFLRAVGDVPGVHVAAPGGAFYMFPRFDVPGVPAARLAELLLEVGGIAATAGTEFGACGEAHLRFTLRVPPENMPAVAAGIAKALGSLRSARG